MMMFRLVALALARISTGLVSRDVIVVVFVAGPVAGSIPAGLAESRVLAVLAPDSGL